MRFSRKIIILIITLFILVMSKNIFSQDVLPQEAKTGYDFSDKFRDPFSPLISKNGLILIAREMDVTGMVLSGIIYSEGESIAIINNELVKIGDMLGDYEIVDIQEKKVILEKDNQGFTLELEE